MKNEGKETILRWFSSCSANDIPGIALLMPNGDWEGFPHQMTLCGRNVLEVRSLEPGESYVLHFRLADPLLQLDTSFPPDDGRIHMYDRYRRLLEGPGPRMIRAQWNIDGCIASEKFKHDMNLEPFAAVALCHGGAKPNSQFIALQSNELTLRSGAPDSGPLGSN